MARYILIVLFMASSLCNAQQNNSTFNIDESYLSKHDIVYKTPAYQGFEGFPFGNGDLGNNRRNISQPIARKSHVYFDIL